ASLRTVASHLSFLGLTERYSYSKPSSTATGQETTNGMIVNTQYHPKPGRTRSSPPPAATASGSRSLPSATASGSRSLPSATASGIEYALLLQQPLSLLGLERL
ncbi:10256_t:CDS:2, partial [Ambispora gerdemannii]